MRSRANSAHKNPPTIAGRVGSSSLWAMVFAGASALVHVSFFWLYFDGVMQSGGDTPVYAELSRGFWTGHGMTLAGKPSATYPPVYPAFYAALAPSGSGGVVLATAQIAVSASIAAAIYSIARYSFGHRAAVLAGLFTVLAPQFPFWAAYALSDSLGLALGVWGLWGIVAASESVRKKRRLAIAGGAVGTIGGLLIGLGVLTRPLNASAFLVAGAGMVWMTRRRLAEAPSLLERPDSSLVGLRALAVVVALGFVIPVGVWTTRNYIELNAFVPLSTRTGWQLWQGVLWDLEGRGTVGKDVYYPEEASQMEEVEADSYLVQKSLESIVENPGKFVGKLITKLVFLWLPSAPGLGPGMLASGVYFCWVAAMAAVAVVARPTRPSALPFWLGAFGVSIGVGLTILDPEYRYRLPLLALLLPPAGAGFEVFGQKMLRIYSGSTEGGAKDDRYSA